MSSLPGVDTDECDCSDCSCIVDDVVGTVADGGVMACSVHSVAIRGLGGAFLLVMLRKACTA